MELLIAVFLTCDAASGREKPVSDNPVYQALAGQEAGCSVAN